MGNKLVVSRRGGITILSLDVITYLENQKRKVIVHTADGVYEEYGRLTDIIVTLDSRFYQCHRSYLLNMDSISSMENQQITFCDGSVIFLGRETFARTRRKVREYTEQKMGNSIEKR